MTSSAHPQLDAALSSDTDDAGSGSIMLPLWASVVLCFGLSLAMHLPWLANTPIAGTEGHRLLPAHEMVQSHWWLVPRLFGTPFLTKPPFHHWLIALSEVIAGRGNVFVWRLPSALSGALLCAAVCLFGGRWFGKTAGLISGMSAVGMIAIWGQSQVADIDATNTLAAAVAALCGVELLIVRDELDGAWLVATTLAMVATWMTKGPAGLPIILGVWIWAVIVTVSEDRSRRLIWPEFWLPHLIGIAVVGWWFVSARHSVLRHGLPFDKQGAQEGTDRLIGKSLGAYLQSLFVMLPQVIAFGFPVTATLALYFHANVCGMMKSRHRRIALALAAGVLLSWVICFISGMTNPRYAYPTLLPLCPLAGAVAVRAVRSPGASEWLRGIAMATVIAMVAAAVGLAAAAWKAPHFHPLLIGSVVAGCAIAALTVASLPRSWAAAWGMIPLVLLVSIPFGVQRQWSRTTRDSGIQVAPTLREIVGEHGAVAACGAVTSKPETFFYANVRTHFVPLYQFHPDMVKPGTWVVLDQAEHKDWLRRGAHLEQDRKLCRWGVTDYFIAWYAK